MVTATSVRIVAGVLFLGTVATASLLASPAETIATLDSIADDPLLFGMVIAGLYLVRPVFAWPTTPLAVVVGYGYGITLGVPIALLGLIFTVIPVFLAVRWFVSGSTTDRTIDGWIADLVDRTGYVLTNYYTTVGPVRGVTVTRLAPIPSDIATATAAVSGVKLRYFVAGTAIGELPWTVAAVIIGATAGTLTTGNLGEIGLPVVVGCIFAGILLLSGPIYRVLRVRYPTIG